MLPVFSILFTNCSRLPNIVEYSFFGSNSLPSRRISLTPLVMCGTCTENSLTLTGTRLTAGAQLTIWHVRVNSKARRRCLVCQYYSWPNTVTDYWNDRRSCRVFLCFHSAIFQQTSAKFQTFAYNSRTVWSSYMKFWQQFETRWEFASKPSERPTRN